MESAFYTPLQAQIGNPFGLNIFGNCFRLSITPFWLGGSLDNI
jgi:hypothetical protein